MTRPRLMRLGALAALTAGVLAQGARANDSTAALGAGGIVLTTSADIRMASEDLYISREIVRVRYSFVNESGAAISTRVAFPLPEADLEALSDSDVGWPTDNPANIVDFKLRIDGRAVRPELEEKAFRKGVDVSDVLRRLHVPFGYRNGYVAEALKKLPASAKQELARRGLADFSNDYPLALWTVKSTFHWQQTFPTGRPVAVEHEYKPVAGAQMISATGFFEHPNAFKQDEFYKGFCIDDATYAGIAARLRAQQRKQGEGAVLLNWIVEYVLTTGKNWKGPIGRFRLTLDKGRPENLISLCMDGVRKSGPTTFTVERTAFEPEQDLKLMIVEAPRP